MAIRTLGGCLATYPKIWDQKYRRGRGMMAEVKGKFITMACSLLEIKPEAKAEAMEAVKSLTGKQWDQLEPEGWYGTNVFDAIFRITEKHHGPVMGWAAIKIMGRRVFSTKERTVGLPKHLKTPLDWLKWEGNGFMEDHRGADVVPRKFLKTEPGNVVVEAVSPGYNCMLIEGVYEGILEMCGIKKYKVTQARCVKKGDSTCEYHIEWSNT
jgi:hypothetical protein